MQTALQRCPRSSVEQLGQIEDASLFRFTAMPPAAAGAAGVCVEAEELAFAIAVELMSGVVAQIVLRENANIPRKQCATWCENTVLDKLGAEVLP